MPFPGGGWSGRFQALVHPVLLGVLLIGLAGTAALSSDQLLRRRSGPDPRQELMYFPSGKLLKALSMGNALFVADLVWARGIQYYGEHRLTDQRFEHIGHIFDVATRFDPHFINAYLFGGLVLAAEGGDPHRAIAFMKRGVARNPHDYLLPFEIGFVYQIHLEDMERAAYYYRRALATPDCPPFVKRFAAFAWEKTARTDLAFAMWAELAATTEHPILKQIAAERAARLREQLHTKVVD